MRKGIVRFCLLLFSVVATLSFIDLMDIISDYKKILILRRSL